MTGGNVEFSSGNEEPITIEDWDYMLLLFKQYFEAAGMAYFIEVEKVSSKCKAASRAFSV